MSAGESIRRARTALGLTQVELAARAGISRQALGAIESDTYQPGVSVALTLAHALGESVESLFGAEADDSCRHIAANWQEGDLSASRTMPTRVALGRVGGKLVAVTQTAAHLMLAPGCGLLERAARHRAEVSTFLSDDEIDATLLVAGCDPAAAILTDWLARHRSPISAISLPCSSGRALANVVAGRVHTAGVHLRDVKNGEYNSESVHRALGKRRAMVVGFGRWELGLAQDRITGYGNEFGGHLEVAAAIAGGQADAGVTIRVAAEVFGLGFVPIREERYDLVILEREMKSAPVVAMLDALNSRRFAREVSQLCGYDTDQMGQVAARLN